MKKMVFFLIMLLVLTVLLLFFFKGRDGRSLLESDKIRDLRTGLPEHLGLEDLIEKIKQPFENQSGSRKDNEVIYRWKNADGVWCFSNQPNPDGPSEIMQMSKEASVVRMHQPKPKEDAKEVKDKAQQKPSAQDESIVSSPVPSTTAIPLLQAPELIKKAEKLKEQLNKRTQEMEDFPDKNPGEKKGVKVDSER